MKAALLIVLSLSALAYAGPAFNKNQNQVDADKAYQQQQQQLQNQQYMTQGGDWKQTQATETLKQWCFSSQLSQQELTASFKKLVGIVKSSPQDQSTEAAVMSERICQGALVQKSSQNDETVSKTGADAQAHELIKDVYMDSLIACESRECMQQLIKIINSNKVDAVRASYYMTRIAVAEKDSIKDESEIKQLAESFINSPQQPASEAVERQKLFAVTAVLGKSLQQKIEQEQQTPTGELKQVALQVAKTIVDRYVKPVSQQEVQQHQQQPSHQQSEQVAKKIAKRNAALKALANIPGCVLKECGPAVEAVLEIAQNKQEISTARQSAIECLEQNDQAQKELKQITFDQQEPTEVRIAAYRALMTIAYAGMKDEQSKQQTATEIVDQVVKHCEDQRNQQQDDQFVLYVVSHLNNIRTSQQPEHKAIKECIAKNKQHYMQIQLLNQKLKQQLSDVRKSSRNYKLEQEFNQIESGLIVEGDLIFESDNKQHQQYQVLPKLARVNVSMPIMGETVNVVEVTVRQNQMDEELLGALNYVQNAKFNSESVSKMVDSFKNSVEKQQQQQQQQHGKQHQGSAEADLSIKVDGCTVLYVCVDDIKSSQSGHQRNTRSIYSTSIVDEIIQHLKRKPVAFNRGFNLNINERIAKVLDVDANLIAGLRFESRANGQSSNDYEIVARVEPRVAFEAVVGPAKVTSKKLLQRFSTKTAVALRLRYKSNELVDVQVDLPMNTMELFTVETQMVEKSRSVPYSYNYLPESIYGQEDIYTPDEIFARTYPDSIGQRQFKRSIFSDKKSSTKQIAKFIQGKQGTFAHSIETPEEVARATGLRGKVRMVASPKDASMLLQAIVEKYEPSMQGYRVKVEKIERGTEQKQYLLSVSTPGSRVDRSMQIRLSQQSNSQRTSIKSEIQSPKMNLVQQIDLVHDGRQYAMKVQVASMSGRQQWRHVLEAGVQRSSQAGRIAGTYKPFLSVDSTLLKRPIQLQGAVSYQQQPKTVISYELKSQTTGDFISGKFILDERTGSYLGKRPEVMRRSMRSPIELLFQNDYTATLELMGQVQEHVVKSHKMLDWSASKKSLSYESSSSHKNLRKSAETQLLTSLKLDADQQYLAVQLKKPQDSRKEFRATIASDTKSPSGHELTAEIRYNGKRASNSLIAYKHKIEANQISSKKIDLGFVVELVATEKQINEKVTGRTQINLDRRVTQIQSQMSSRDKQAKLALDWVSANEHQLDLQVQGGRVSHKTQVQSNQRQYSLQSRTEMDRQMLAKLVVELLKQQDELSLVFEVPTKGTYVAADLKPESGKVSSWAIQTPRFASKAELTFDMSRSGYGKRSFSSLIKKPFQSTFRFKSDLKDQMNQEAYWMESAWNGLDKSYFRVDSPIYRTDFEFSPREQQSKFGMFARSKRSVNLSQLYSNDDSIIGQSILDKINNGNKMWMLRSVFSSPSNLQQLKQQARQALFEYADRRNQYKHSFNWSPEDERIKFNFDRSPISGYESQYKPMRFSGDCKTNYYGKNELDSRPCNMQMESEFYNFELDTKPFGSDDLYAKYNVLSRHPRSAFKKHEGEYRYNKDQGHKAWMKHTDQKDKKHSIRVEADKSPKNWGKMSWESDKHGKGEWQHQWRKEVTKRSHDGQEVYQNRFALKGQSPQQGDWSHQSQFEWEEPRNKVWNMRQRRDLSDLSTEAKRRFSTYDYLKHVNARLNSQTMRNQNELYNVNFDYQPEQMRTRFNLAMPGDMLHESSLEYEPTERLYKLSSKLLNQRTQKPTYELFASTKPIMGLATAEQEPLFIDQSHPMIESPLGLSTGIRSRLFKQPLKFDYNDIYGRVARFDYDQSPLSGKMYGGLRQKRAAVYYKDDVRGIEHDSAYDFYPEAILGFKPSKRVPGDVTVKASTKYGPVILRADSDDKTMEVQLESPVFNAKLVGETSTSGKRGNQLFKVYVDNKQQTVPLYKLVRQTPLIKDSEIAKELAKKVDAGRFEHQTELLVNIYETILKIKSQTVANSRPVMTVEGEYNQQQNKAVVKINGERTKGQMYVDLVSKSAELVLDVDDKRTVYHQTRLVRTSDKFYSLESMTSYKQKPLAKLSAKICSMIFSEPEHLFSKRRSGASFDDHLSVFEAVVYEPKEIRISGQYDYVKKEAHIVSKDVESQQVQETLLKFNDQTDSVVVDARLSSPRGTVYSGKALVGLQGLIQPGKCQRYNQPQSCQSELIYSDRSGSWSAKYIPGEYIAVNTPRGSESIDLSHFY